MPISWITALKAVPWTDLVQAAPHIVKGARTLFTTVKNRAAGDAAQAGVDHAPEYSTPAELAARLADLGNAVQSLQTEQQSSAELIRSLAEQNARVVEAIAVMRARVRMLTAACAVLAIALASLAVWIATR